MSDILPLTIAAIFSVCILAIVIFLATNQKECLKYENQLVHHPGWFQFIPVSNNTTVPIWHAPRSNYENVCVQYKDGEESEKASGN